MLDAELDAMEKVLSALSVLDAAARLRVMRWVAEKLDVPTISASKLPSAGGGAEKGDGAEGQGREKFETSLGSHIRTKCKDGSQVLRFLVTADWLRRRGQSLTSGAVAKALVDNQQSRLANPADCLNKNVAKGFCEKTKEGFFITPEGLKELEYSS